MISVKRDRLLAAGKAIAEKKPSLSALNPEAIAAAARLEPAHFEAEFASMDEYLVELQRSFLESTLSVVVAELGAAVPGLERMVRAMNLQLDACLQQRGLRRLLVEARRRVPPVAETFYKQGNVTALMIGIELKSLGCPNPAEVGRLYWALMIEAAQIEAENGQATPSVRKTLRDFLAAATG
jgi:hypothetical protein